jgi:hypothetical protein
MGPQSWSGRCEEEKNFAPIGNRKPSHPAHSPSLYRLPNFRLSEYWATLYVLDCDSVVKINHTCTPH